MRLLVTGGSGSGKSVWAEKVIRSLPETVKYYIATMQVYDEESRLRVQRHRVQRCELGMVTLECPKGIGAQRLQGGCAALLEDIPNLLANEMFDGGDPERIIGDIESLSAACSDLIIVTNDVFSDGVRYDGGTAEYVRRLAGINRALAAMCDSVVEVVYSVPVRVKGVLPCV